MCSRMVLVGSGGEDLFRELCKSENLDEPKTEPRNWPTTHSQKWVDDDGDEWPIDLRKNDG